MKGSNSHGPSLNKINDNEISVEFGFIILFVKIKQMYEINFKNQLNAV